MDEADRLAILDLPCRVRTREAQAYLVREGDQPDICAVLVSGYAFRHKLTGDGARQILALHIPGEVVDFQHMFLDEADDATGLTSVHVNRVLKGLQADGLIERDRRAIRFPDWERMRDVGDFSMRYLHLRDEDRGAFADTFH